MRAYLFIVNPSGSLKGAIGNADRDILFSKLDFLEIKSCRPRSFEMVNVDEGRQSKSRAKH